MNNLGKFFVSLLSLIFVVGCATTAPYTIKESEGGLLVSVVHNSKCEVKAFTSSVMKITPVGFYHMDTMIPVKSRSEYRFTIYSPMLKTNKDNRGFVQFISMKPGEYWLSGFIGMGWNVRMTEVEPFKLAFTIKPDVITYIGELEMALSECGYNNYKTHNLTHIPFEIRSDMEKDISILDALHPGFASQNIVAQSMKYLKSQEIQYPK